MSDSPEISVIVPVYKVRDYLEDCVQSILQQSYKNFELLLVDDCSPDDCGAVCDQLALTDERIRVFHRKKNGGLSAARNTGIEAAMGNYLCFVDSDDLLSPMYLEILRENAVKFHADVSICGFERFYDDIPEQGQIESQITWLNKKDLWLRLAKTGGAAEIELIVAWNKLIRAEIAKKLRFRPGVWHEDEFYINELATAAKTFIQTPAPLYFYRQRKESIMGSKSAADFRHLSLADAFRCRVDACRCMHSFRIHYKMVHGYRKNLIFLYHDFGDTEAGIRLKKQLFTSILRWPIMSPEQCRRIHCFWKNPKEYYRIYWGEKPE